MDGDPFVDTNVLLYALSPNDLRAHRAQQVMRSGGVVSVQVLNEFVAVTRRRLMLDWTDIEASLALIQTRFKVMPVSLETHRSGLKIAQFYGFRIYDSLLLASALEAGCTTFLSEDLQDGQVIDSALTVHNPFV